MTTTFEKIRAMKAEYEAIVAKEGKAALQEEFAAYFAAHPDIEAVRWTQYTPYFNDGDPCTFRMNDMEFRGDKLRSRFASDREDVGDSGDFVESWCLDEKVREVVDTIETDDDVYNTVFGDGVRVTATRDGFAVDEYDHD